MTDKSLSSSQRRGWISSRVANTLRYSQMNLFILLGTALIALGSWWTFGGLVCSFIIIGFVDEAVGDAREGEDMPPVWYMNFSLWLTLPLLVLSTLVAFTVVGDGIWWVDAALRSLGYDPAAARAITGPITGLGAFVSLGMYYGAAGINVAHELVHRTGSAFDLIVGRWLLAFTFDTGFSIEHVYGHHKNVATELDPATARRGETVYQFVVRSTLGQFVGAWRLERERLARKGETDVIWNNRFWRGQAMSGVIWLAYIAALGWWGLVLAPFAAAIGKIYLEIVNYVEHYGLVRIPGTRVESRHAWDSYRRVSTGMFYNLPLHSNHHKFATRPFWDLKQTPEDGPQMPMGYMGTILTSFWPPLWNRVMNPRLADWDRRFASPAEREYLQGMGLLRG